jgi:hypothetical protein
MPGNPLVRFDEGRVGRTERCPPSLLLYRETVFRLHLETQFPPIAGIHRNRLPVLHRPLQ